MINLKLATTLLTTLMLMGNDDLIIKLFINAQH